VNTKAIQFSGIPDRHYTKRPLSYTKVCGFQGWKLFVRNGPFIYNGFGTGSRK
jgi:hypothetical protein